MQTRLKRNKNGAEQTPLVNDEKKEESEPESDDLPKVGDHEEDDGLNKDELLKEFFSVYKEKAEKYAEMTSPTEINQDMISFLKSKGITGKIVSGKIELDNPDIKAEDFNEKQLKFMTKHGYDTSKSDDLMKFCIKNNLFSKIKMSEHSWIQVKDLILDPAGKFMFKDTKKAKDLSDERYNKVAKKDQEDETE